ncbi:hypothetical protein [Halomarina pelagica]|uniref:hypothetical protein n=1 Tax=Halomarina pelagica TaxID=2961599 RepID=UPI0020C2B4D7|nr:hypothetical protein [Halomarina sp. BND7]
MATVYQSRSGEQVEGEILIEALLRDRVYPGDIEWSPDGETVYIHGEPFQRIE